MNKQKKKKKLMNRRKNKQAKTVHKKKKKDAYLTLRLVDMKNDVHTPKLLCPIHEFSFEENNC